VHGLAGTTKKAEAHFRVSGAGIGTNRIQFRLDGEPPVKLGVVDGIALNFE